MNLVKKQSFLLLFLSLLIWGSCQNDQATKVDRALEAIPSNATVVTAFDMPTLLNKANFEAVKKMDFYRFFMEKAQEESDILAAVFANPENAGIDLTKNAYLSIELNPDNPEEIYTGIIFNLASPEDFNGFANSFRSAKKGNRNGYQIADLNENTQIAWNDQVGVLALGEGIYETEEVVNAFFAPSNPENLVNNENLTTLLSEKHDITTWLTSNALAQNKNAQLLLSLAKIKPEAIKDNFIHGHVDFDQGEVEAKLNFFLQDALIEDIDLLFKSQVATDFSPYLSSKNLNLYLTTAFDFEGLNTVLNKRPKVKMFADFALKSFGLSIQKLADALDGDLVFTTYTGNLNNQQEGLFATKLKNQSQFENLLDLAEENDLVTKTAKGRYLIAPSLVKIISSLIPLEIGSEFDNQLLIKDGIAFVSGNIDRLDAIDEENIHPTEQLPTNLKEIMNQNPFALFVDFNSLKRTGIPGTQALDLLEFYSNKEGANFELTLQQKEINSLQAIFEAINEEFIKDKERKQPVSQEKS